MSAHGQQGRGAHFVRNMGKEARNPHGKTSISAFRSFGANCTLHHKVSSLDLEHEHQSNERPRAVLAMDRGRIHFGRQGGFRGGRRRHHGAPSNYRLRYADRMRRVSRAALAPGGAGKMCGAHAGPVSLQSAGEVRKILAACEESGW